MRYTQSEIDDLEIPIPPNFHPHNPFGVHVSYRKNLPHWRQDGATYAVTFRTADSIPRSILSAQHAEAQRWKDDLKKSIEREGKIPETLENHYRDFQRKFQRHINTELDRSHGLCRLRERENQEVVQESLNHFDDLRYSLFGAAIMPNHVHVLIQPFPEYPLESILQSWKTYTSRNIQHRERPFWQSESYDRIIRDEKHFISAAQYILANPLKARLGSNNAIAWVRGATLRWGPP